MATKEERKENAERIKRRLEEQDNNDEYGYWSKRWCGSCARYDCAGVYTLPRGEPDAVGESTAQTSDYVDRLRAQTPDYPSMPEVPHGISGERLMDYCDWYNLYEQDYGPAMSLFERERRWKEFVKERRRVALGVGKTRKNKSKPVEVSRDQDGGVTIKISTTSGDVSVYYGQSSREDKDGRKGNTGVLPTEAKGLLPSPEYTQVAAKCETS